VTRAHQQRRAQGFLHIADPSAGGSERQMRTPGAMRDAAGFHNMTEEAEVGEIKAHGSAFATNEGFLFRTLIALGLY
jgi:hypothetical protein